MRKKDAWLRIAEAMDKLAERLGIDAPPDLRRNSGDFYRRQATRLEDTASFLEALVDLLYEPPPAGAKPKRKPGGGKKKKVVSEPA